MDIFKEISYWTDLIQNDLKIYDTEEKKERVKGYFCYFAREGTLKYHFLEDKKGLIVYTIAPDYRGNLTLQEMLMYIKPEYRGSIRLFKELICHIEQAAKENNCDSVRIGANILFKDEKILKALQHLGYKTDTVVKYIGGNNGSNIQ